MKRIAMLLALCMALSACVAPADSMETTAATEPSETTVATESTATTEATEEVKVPVGPLPITYFDPIRGEYTEPLEIELAEKAEAYVKKYINQTLCYHEEDFSEGVAQGEDPGDLTFLEDHYPLSYLLENLKLYEAMADYSYESKQDIMRLDVEAWTEVADMVIEENMAWVRLFAVEHFRYPDKDVTSEMGDYHDIFFAKLEDSWQIVMAYTEEMKFMGVTPAVAYTRKDPEPPAERPDSVVVDDTYSAENRAKHWKEAPYAEGENPVLPPDLFQRYSFQAVYDTSEPTDFYVYVYRGTEPTLDFPEWGVRLHIPEEWMEKDDCYIMVRDWKEDEFIAFVGHAELTQNIFEARASSHELGCDAEFLVHGIRREAYDADHVGANTRFMDSHVNSIAYFEAFTLQDFMDRTSGKMEHYSCHVYRQTVGDEAFWALADELRCTPAMREEILEVYEP